LFKYSIYFPLRCLATQHWPSTDKRGSVIIYGNRNNKKLIRAGTLVFFLSGARMEGQLNKYIK
jgi:hypothetical protein